MSNPSHSETKGELSGCVLAAICDRQYKQEGLHLAKALTSFFSQMLNHSDPALRGWGKGMSYKLQSTKQMPGSLLSIGKVIKFLAEGLGKGTH